MDLFDRASFDLNAYLARIEYSGSADATLQTLAGIAVRHPAAIPFENLDPFFGRPVALDIRSLQAKLVFGGRGGYCFEHNILLGTALAAIGFEVTGLAARVMWNAPAGPPRPRSHMLLLVQVRGEPYLVDAGFGGLTLTGPLRLEADVEQETPHERFRLAREHGGFVMQASVRGGWKALYRFDLQPQALADYEVTNWYLSHHPQSPFVTTLVGARVKGAHRYALRNMEWAVHDSRGGTERRLLTSAVELRRSLVDMLGTRVPDDVSLDQAFARFGTAAMPT